MKTPVKGKKVKYVENFRFDLSSPACRGYNNVYVKDNALVNYGTFSRIFTHGEKFFNFIGVVNGKLYLHAFDGLERYNGNGQLTWLPMFDNVVNGCTDGHLALQRDMQYLTLNGQGLWAHDTTISLPKMNVFHSFNDRTIDDVAVVNDRPVVLTDKDKLYFADSDDRYFSNYEAENVGYLRLPSEIGAIEALGFNTLYALGDACYKVTFGADERKVKIETLAQKLGTAFAHSAAVVGDKLIFATTQGLYAVKGNKVTRIFKQLDESFYPYDDCHGFVWKGNYLFSTVLNGECMSYLLDVDKQLCLEVLPKGVRQVFTHQGEDLVLTDKKYVMLWEKDLYGESRFVRRNVDFGTSARKYLRQLIVDSRYDVEVRVIADGAEYSYSVKGRNGVQKIPLSANGRLFDAEIISNGSKLEIHRFEIVAETYKEDNYGN